MKVAIDSDATGRSLKRDMVRFIEAARFEVHDLNAPDGDHYPEISTRLAKRIASGEFERGVLICATGLGMAMAANKVRGVFAGTPQNIGAARKMAESNNAQIITVGAGIFYADWVGDIIKAFLETPFQPRRNADRMRELELQQ